MNPFSEAVENGCTERRIWFITLLVNKGLRLRVIIILVICGLLSVGAVAENNHEIVWARSLIEEGKKAEAYRPKNGYVPNEKAAIGIAMSVWTPIYGNEQIEKQKPHSVMLVDGYWVVSGYLSKVMVGGVAHAVINKKTGQVIYVMHTK